MIKHFLSKLVILVVCLLPLAGYSQSTFTIQVGPGSTNTFAPANVTCTVGDTIAFVWVSGFHPTQSVDLTTIPLQNMDGTAGNGSVYKIKMNTAGSFAYECTAHAGMGGTITVNAAPSNTPLLVENFSYTAGSALTANGYAAHSGAGTNTISVTNGGLSYPGSPNSNIGNAAYVMISGEDINKAFTLTPITSGSVYASFLVKVDSVKSTTGDYFFHLGPSPIGSDFKGKVFAKASGSGYQIGVSKAANAGTAGSIYDPTVYSFGATVMVAIKYTIVPGATNDEVSLFVNPALGTSEPAPTVSALSSEADISASGIATYAIRQGAAAQAPGLTIDALMIGQTWASVTPTTPSVRFNPTVQSVNENVGSATLTVTIANPSSSPTSVDVVLKGGTATPGADFTYPTTKTVTFPASSTTSQTISIPIIDDTDPEMDETIEFVLRNATNGAAIGTDSIHTITILANDIVAPIVNFVAPHAVTKAEGTNHVFSVSITNHDANATSVKVYVKSTSTADASDYSGITASGLSLTFPGGSNTNQSENISIIDDQLPEPAETIVLVLRDPTNNAIIGSDSIITITIPANDQPMVVHFLPTTLTVNENAGTVNGTVMVMGANSNSTPTSFDVVLKGGTATPGDDFTYTTTTVTIPPHTDSMVAIPVTIINDTQVEPNETILLAIRNITNNGTIATDSVLTITIISDDVDFVSYTSFPGTGALSANGWASHSGTLGQIQILTTPSDLGNSLAYTGMPEPLNNRITTVAGNSEDVNVSIAPITSGSGYSSFFMKVTDSIGLHPHSAVGDYFYHFADTTTGTTTGFVGRTYIRKGSQPSTFNIGIRNFSGGTTTSDGIYGVAPADYTIGQTYLIVIKHNYATEESSIFVNPSLTATEPAATHVSDEGSGTFPTRARYLCIRQAGNATAGTGNIEIDEIRIGNAWTDVIIPDTTSIIPSVRLDSASYSVMENGGSKVVKVLLSSRATQTTSVTFAITGGTATINDNYTVTIPQPVTFNTGDSVAQLTFNIIDNLVPGTDKTILFALSAPSNCTLGTPVAGTLTIKDNDLVGINHTAKGKFEIYPNPASEEVTIKSSSAIRSISVMNMIGQEVISVSDVNASSNTLAISKLESGLYSVIVRTDNGISTQKLVVK